MRIKQQSAKQLQAMQKLSQELSFTSPHGELFRQLNQENLANIRQAQNPAQTEKAVRQAVQHSTEAINQLELPGKNTDATGLANSLNMQWDALAKTQDMQQTPEITSLRNHFLQNNYIEGLEAFSGAFQKGVIEASNLALLKEAAPLRETVAPALPKGVTTVLRNMHVGTARHLAASEDVAYSLEKRRFFLESAPEKDATLAEANLLASSLDILTSLEYHDLLDFMNALATTPEFASTHTVGRQIQEVIANWQNTQDFDCRYYYHGRAFIADSCPYTEHQMTAAPYGVTWHGRYNHIGESHYYFSDQLVGALREVHKHCAKNTLVQIAKIKPIRSIRMIDLSREIKAPNKFLEYCRFSPDPADYSKVKREYLIPCYVATCCKLHGIEGVKYYGSRDYANYVTWKDGYFTFVSFEAIAES